MNRSRTAHHHLALFPLLAFTKLEPGQRGVWILHQGELAGAEVQAYPTALEPLDVQPTEELPRLQELLGKEK